METVISVPVWDLDENQFYYTHRFVTEVLEKTTGDFCLAIVDNGSEYEPTRSFLDSVKDQRFKLIRNRKNLGYAKGANQGIKWGLANGATYGVIMNQDIFINVPQWLQYFIEPLRENPKQLIGARVIPDNGLTDIDGNGCIPYAEGWMVAFEKSLVDAIGLPFDATIHSYFEDTDLSVRATLAGFPVIQSDCFSWASNGHISVAHFISGVATHIGGATGYARPDSDWSRITRESREYFTKKWNLTPKEA